MEQDIQKIIELANYFQQKPDHISQGISSVLFGLISALYNKNPKYLIGIVKHVLHMAFEMGVEEERNIRLN